MSFESLEDNFMKKVNEPVKTDVQQTIDDKKSVSDSENKETYEDNLTKKQVIGGLAALFQDKIKNKKSSDDDDEDNTVFIKTDNLKYGDNFQDATNYVTEEDIQKFMPGDIYNDSIKEPDIAEGSVQIDQRHTPANRYDDNLTFEPHVASEGDISPQSSISKSVNADTPYSDADISNKLATHNEQKKKKQFSENVWSPKNSYNTGVEINPSDVNSPESDISYQETELSHDEYESNLKQSNNIDTNGGSVD